MEIEAALFWVIMALMLVVFAVFPSVADFCAMTFGESMPQRIFCFCL